MFRRIRTAYRLARQASKDYKEGKTVALYVGKAYRR